MKSGMEIITSDGKRIGYLGPIPAFKTDALPIARSPYTIPWDWIARIDQEVILRRTQGGEWIEPLELVVDEAGVAHDQPSFGQTLQKARKQHRKILSAAEVVGSRESRIAADPERRGPSSHSGAEDVEQEPLAVGEPV